MMAISWPIGSWVAGEVWKLLQSLKRSACRWAGVGSEWKPERCPVPTASSSHERGVPSLG